MGVYIDISLDHNKVMSVLFRSLGSTVWNLWFGIADCSQIHLLMRPVAVLLRGGWELDIPRKSNQPILIKWGVY